MARGRLPHIPSWGLGTPPRRVRLLAVLAVRDEMHNLPGWFRNVAPHVDGVAALDDGSTDGSAEFLASRPEVLELLRIPPDRPGWDEVGNYRLLVQAALRQGADWIVSLDADERVEWRFRTRAERVIGRGGLLGFSAYAFRLRELWGAPDHYRADGVWGVKLRARLFQARPDHAFDERPLHTSKAPEQSRVAGGFPRADLEVYHLRMISSADRVARRARYEALDPDARYQPVEGYAYLTDERGLKLKRVPLDRRWREA